MRPVPTRVRPTVVRALAGAGAAAVLAACGSAPDPDPANLLESLPTSAVTATPTTSPSVAAPTTTGPAKPASGRPPRRPRLTPDAGTAPGAIGPEWKPVGGDEFNGTSVDPSKWGIYNSVGAFGNGKRRPSAMSAGGGVMSITAITGTKASDDVSGGMADSFSQLYGRWEARVRTDLGRGYSGVVLLWPDSESTNDGEIDIMEVPSETRNRAVIVLHSGKGGSSQVGTDVPGRFDQWHTVAVEWLPTKITWYVDGRRQYTVTDKARIPTTPMHLTLQLDQGPVENWLLAPDATTPPKLTMQVDYVRVWSWAGAPAVTSAPVTTTAAPTTTADRD